MREVSFDQVPGLTLTFREVRAVFDPEARLAQFVDMDTTTVLAETSLARHEAESLAGLPLRLPPPGPDLFPLPTHVQDALQTASAVTERVLAATPQVYESCNGVAVYHRLASAEETHRSKLQRVATEIARLFPPGINEDFGNAADMILEQRARGLESCGEVRWWVHACASLQILMLTIRELARWISKCLPGINRFID